ncbi:MAG: hypothetical protein C4346_13830, partial [Chloroflexota bacterium]
PNGHDLHEWLQHVAQTAYPPRSQSTAERWVAYSLPSASRGKALLAALEGLVLLIVGNLLFTMGLNEAARHLPQLEGILGGVLWLEWLGVPIGCAIWIWRRLGWKWGVFTFVMTPAAIARYIYKQRRGTRPERAGHVLPPFPIRMLAGCLAAFGVVVWITASSIAGASERVAPAVSAPNTVAQTTSAADQDAGIVADLDTFWQANFAANGLDYEGAAYQVFDGEVTTACGSASESDHLAFYCSLDETIYVSAAWRSAIKEHLGDLPWVVVIAHEWGHHVEEQLGIWASAVPPLTGGVYSIQLELEADCLAGVYVHYAEAQDWIEATDVLAAVELMMRLGDPAGTPWFDPDAHGTAEQRVTAFVSGYRFGLPSCRYTG